MSCVCLLQFTAHVWRLFPATDDVSRPAVQGPDEHKSWQSIALLQQHEQKQWQWHPRQLPRHPFHRVGTEWGKRREVWPQGIHFTT